MIEIDYTGQHMGKLGVAPSEAIDILLKAAITVSNPFRTTQRAAVAALSQLTPYSA